MLIHKGTKQLETSRLILRRAVRDDANAMYRNWASDPDVVRYLTWPVHENEEISGNIVQSWIDEYNRDNFYQWLIVLKDINEPIGCISGISLNDELEAIEIGYCIGSRWWHRGIMTRHYGRLFTICSSNVGLIESLPDMILQILILVM